MKKIVWTLLLCSGLWACSQGDKEEAGIANNTTSTPVSETSNAQPSSNKQSVVKDISNPKASAATPKEESNKPASQLAAFGFAEDTYDFGVVREGEIVTHIFKFTNEGSVPLVIDDARASCGCTVPEWPKEPIAPGATGEIKVEFNSNNKPGNVNKSVSITANTKPAVTTIFIKGEVKGVSKMNGPLRR